MLHATRGKSKSKRHFNICICNPRKVKDLNFYALETMLHDLSDVKCNVVGFSETKVKEYKIETNEDTVNNLFFLEQ